MLLLVAAAVPGFVIWRATQEVDPGWLSKLNQKEADEARRKIKLVSDALKSSKRGFVNLSQLEINSYITANTTEAVKGKTNTGPAVLVKSCMDMSYQDFGWYCLVKKTIYGKTFEVTWERTVGLEQAGGKWTFPIKTMRVGEFKVPKQLWQKVEQFFGPVDQIYNSDFEWLSKLPGIQITTNTVTRKPQLTLYSYSLNGPEKK